LTNFNGQDSYPMWAPEGNRIYFVSEQFGPNSNIGFVDIATGPKGLTMSKPQALTHHTDDAVHQARISANGEWIVYECGPDLWVTATKNPQPRKLAIEVYADDKSNTERIVNFTSGASQFSVSADDKSIAFVVHGEIFCMPQSGGKATRLTEHPAYDHGVSWHPDGKKVIFLSDRAGHDDIYQLESDDPEHPDLVGAVKFKTKALTKSLESIAGASYSPDGKKIAFIRSGRLWTMNADGSAVKAIVDEPNVIDYEWSPDSKSFAYSRMDGSWGTEMYIIPAAGGKSENVTRYATYNYDVTWSTTGMKLAFVSERPGPSGMTVRPYVLPLQKPAAPGAPSSSDIDYDDIHLRATAVAPFAASMVAISPDGNRVAFRSGEDLWVVGSDGQGLSKLASSVGPQEIHWTHKSNNGVFFRDKNGQIRLARIGFTSLAPGIDPPPINFTAKMVIKRDEEYAEIFEQSWRWLADSFYDVGHHGANWDAVRAKYQPLVKHVGNKEDLYALVSLMLGELNASHLGIYGPSPQPEEVTADLGLIFDENYRGPGKKVLEVLKRGPADKRGINLKPGDLILSIDRTPVTAKTNLSRLLNSKVNETVLLDVLSRPAGGLVPPRRRVELQAIGRRQASELMYERWCEHNAKIVAEKSGGKIGYIHIPSMDQAGLDRFVRSLYSDNFDKEAIVLDVRYNGGGYTHDQVLNYLTGREHTVFRQREGGSGLVLRAGDRKWTRPLVLLINNQSYSDAEIFPSAFRTLGLGKLVGQPTGGWVIGTAGVTLIDGSTLRVPRTGVWSVKGVNMEKEGVTPDVLVELSPEDAAKGRDPQLDRAIAVVQQDVVVWKKTHVDPMKSPAGTVPTAPVTSPSPAVKP
jgi:tricorn protease